MCMRTEWEWQEISYIINKQTLYSFRAVDNSNLDGFEGHMCLYSFILLFLLLSVST